MWLQLEMYSRKFGLRLQRKFGNLLKTHLRRGFRRGRLRMTRILRERSFRRAAKTNRRAARAPRILLQRNRLLRFFDELFKARIAAQRIPERQQFQFAIAEPAWAADDNGKLFAGEIFFTNPGGGYRQILDWPTRAPCF